MSLFYACQEIAEPNFRFLKAEPTLHRYSKRAA